MTVAVSGLLAGCGSSGGTRDRTAGTTPGAPPVPVVTFTFGPRGITPDPARVTANAAGQLDLALVSADGRPHAAAITVAGRRTRIVVFPGAAQRRRLSSVRPGRYRLVPDGAADPVPLLVGR